MNRYNLSNMMFIRYSESQIFPLFIMFILIIPQKKKKRNSRAASARPNEKLCYYRDTYLMQLLSKYLVTVKIIIIYYCYAPKPLPANKYITPVTRTALIWCWQTPNAPTKAALPSIMRHTRAQDIDKFCIPEKQQTHIE